MSRRRWPGKSLVIAVFGVAVFALVHHGAGEVHAQRDPLSMETKDPLLIGAQLRAGLQFTELALGHFQRQDAFETFEAGYRLTRRAYGQVRMAFSSMNFARRSAKFEDPVLDWEITYTDKAWAHIRLVLDSHTSSTGIHAKPEQIPIDIQNLSEAVRILRRVAALMP